MNTNLLERDLTSRVSDPRVVCTLALILVFFAGAAVGALIMDFGIHNRQRPASIDSPAARALNFEQLKKYLDLTPEQSIQVESALNDFWQYYRGLLGDSKSKVKQLLTPEQQEKFDRWLAGQQKR